ncbi:MAG: glycine--tRNA ligase subunit beta, partial [bacterium]|nr:glycine--tRNA ligase subunit beta [bacterium]
MADLLLEIGCEEIPSGEIDQALVWLRVNAEQILNSNRLKFEEIKTFGTPRRLVLIITDVAAKQTNLSEEVTGPKVEVAYDSSGNLTKAGLGFVNSKGKSAKDAYQKDSAKGKVIALKIAEKGQAANKILPSLLSKLIKDIPFSKTMQWDETEVTFIRPVRWILCLLGSKVLPLTFGKVVAFNKTCGHRFLSTGFKVVKDVQSYVLFLEKNFVMLDGEKRKNTILTEATKLAQSVSGNLKFDEDLLNIVKNLVEFPWPILGDFEKSFLDTPAEILICEMREHQKYFTVVDKNGNLLPAFIVVAGTKPENKVKLAEGNARVLKARFADGAFYFAEDKKTSLGNMALLLDKVVFQKGLGTVLDKTRRIVSLSEAIAVDLALPKTELTALKIASQLCKADLVSGVVAQFPELQGVMGSIYASLSDNSAEICSGIKEHYWPKNASDEVPSSAVGAIISIADRLDT